MAEPKPDLARVLALFDIDVPAGILRWRAVEGDTQAIRARNGRFAGKIVQNKTKQGYYYVRVAIDGKRHFLMVNHILFGAKHNRWPEGMIDHEDGDVTRNVQENFREANKSQNGHNANISKRNKSGYKGVSYMRANGKWLAQIMLNGKRTYIGYFDKAENAAKAYDIKAIELHGAFAKTNAMLGKL